MDRLEALANHIVKTGGKVAYAAADVRRSEDLSSLVQLAREKFGKLDVLVNNAGIMPISPLDDLRVKEWEAISEIWSSITGLLTIK